MGIGLVVIVIFLVVWIVSNVLRAQQDAAQVAAKRTVNRPVGASPPLGGEKGNSEIDRFLQEIDRLRRKGQQEQTEARPSTAREPQPSAMPEPRKPASPQSVIDARIQRKREQKKQKQEQQSRLPAVPVVVNPPSVKLAPLPSVPSLPTQPEPAIVEPRPRIPEQGAVSPHRVARPTRPTHAHTAVAPALVALAALLKSEQGGAVAILLHEILGHPKSKQRRA